MARKTRRTGDRKHHTGTTSPQPASASEGRPPRVGGRGGARLASAFELVEKFPVLAEARSRLVRVAKRRGASPETLSPIVESDLGLTVVILRTANAQGGRRGNGSVPAAVESLGPEGVVRAAQGAIAYDFLDIEGAWGAIPEQMRRHAVATRAAADRIAEIA